MQSLDATLLICQDLLAHLRDQLRSHLSDLLIVTPDRLQSFVEVRGNSHPFSLNPFLEFVPVLDWHDSRDDWHGDSSCSDSLDPVKEDFDVVEQLSEDEIRARVDFLFQPLNLLLLALICLW